ncbi:heme oxygenase [Borreliella spielmanii]|uniref:Heme oxygenase n=1 Tax=Borreliella spielmanii TaxID=88916 RepID=A0ABR6P7X2_9SPIR|nr:BlyB family putative holin accessory protein [Borreliella spielmanii]MBB6032115.1 heme oxygenase [Borreliella spielmanii]
MQNNTISLGLNLLSSLTNIAKTDTNIDHNYINTFSKVIDFFYKTYMSTLKSMETAESTKILEEIQDILKYNIQIIEAISSNKSKRIISSLKAKRNKIMKEYINILKRGENA